MGSARASGEGRAIKAVKAALQSPLLNNNDISGTRNILLNVTSGKDEITMDEIGQITDYIQAVAGEGADLIWGNGTDPHLGDELNVTVIATGFCTSSIPELYIRNKQVDVVMLDGERSENRVIKESLFEVKDRPNISHKRERLTEKELSQRVIEFNDFDDVTKPVAEKGLFDDDEFMVTSVKPQQSSTKEAPTKTSTRQNATPLTAKANIDQMEKIPAYKRKNIKIDEPEHSKTSNVSRFTLSEEEGDIFLKSDNAYLHDNVD